MYMADSTVQTCKPNYMLISTLGAPFTASILVINVLQV